ncbi:MAG: valine--tRNA ligase [Clostridia bacterium]|nr:valine--tRNA ligase [Clostridia bacterium]
MAKQLPKTYAPKEVEDRLYQQWCERGYFTADARSGKKPFSIVIPPPNVTGQLHMGHALNNTMQDAVIRFRRMQGYETLWVPGTDHAGIATQIKVEAELREKEGKTRHDIGREAFLERVWDWKHHYGNRIISQLKKMGSSCDWSRERFTMDEGCSEAVRRVFVELYKKDLIYRGERITNWCTHCATALSDAEVEDVEEQGSLWHIRYDLVDGSGSMTVATTRPETMLGDTAVAVNPEDERYTHLVGKELILPLLGRRIPIVADEYVEKDFGTGCVKITPAHDPNDFEVGARHDLACITVIGEDGNMTAQAGAYAGMDRYAARKQIVKDLEEQGYLEKIEKHVHQVPHCYRCGSVIEPLVSKQWFVRMKPLAEGAIKAVEDGEIRFVPDRFSKTYLNWMNNVHDWCISRQLWWGHRVPAYYCAECGEVTVSFDEVSVCPKCGSKHVAQDPDVLDTWFSSALWPFSTMGWPQQTEDLNKFYPTSVLITAYDIIFFWVARMIFSGLEHTGKAPFSQVLIHGLVRDAQGRKMSKSLGNGIDPLEIIDQYGADALRFTLATGNSPGNDMRFSNEKVEASRNFANKIWNAARFVLMNLDDEVDTCCLPEVLQPEDKWLLSRYEAVVRAVTDNMEKYELGVAVSNLYDFIWDVFCDWYIELVKPRLNDKGTAQSRSAQQMLVYVLSNTLKLLHPFMPFITEEIWQTLPHEGDSIMVSAFPLYDEKLVFPKEEAEMDAIVDAIRAVRVRRGEMNVPPSRKTQLFIETEEEELFSYGTPFFTKLAGASEVHLGRSFNLENTVTVVTDKAKILLPLAELVDLQAEKARLEKERANTLAELERVNNKLANEAFVAKAPAALVEGERRRAEGLQEKLAKLDDSLKAL